MSRPTCFKSKPSPQAQAEHDCATCPHVAACMDDVWELIRNQIPQDATPEELAEAAVGLMAMAEYRASLISMEERLSIVASLSDYTTSAHVAVLKLANKLKLQS
jgi:hypothetical protein